MTFLNQLWCGLWGHSYMRVHDGWHMALRCGQCDHETVGIDVREAA